MDAPRHIRKFMTQQAWSASRSTPPIPAFTPRTRTATGGRLRGVSASFGARYVGDTVHGDVRTPSVTLCDAMLAYGWDRYHVALDARNLADETYVVGCRTNVSISAAPAPSR